jgi:predicted porin
MLDRLASLLAATAFATVLPPAERAGAADIDASLGGFVKLEYGAFDRARELGADGGTVIDGEAHAQVQGQTETGVTYGGRLQLLPAAEARDNGSYVAVGWWWGQFRIGDYGGAAKELSISAPTVGLGQIDGDLDRFGGPSALIAPYKLDNDDSAKLTYLSPMIFGLRLGLSYTPVLTGGVAEIVPAPHAPGVGAHRNVGEFALSESRDFDDLTLTIGGAYVTGAAAPNSQSRGLSGGSLGAKAAWNGFTLGAGFIYDGARTLPADPRPGHVLVDDIVSEFNAGVTYTVARWNFGASWAHDRCDRAATTDLAALGASYRIAPGLTVGADVSHYTMPRGRTQTAADALLFETTAHF